MPCVDPGKKQAYNRAYYVANRKRLLTSKHAWYAANQERAKANYRAWYAANQEKRLAYYRAWHAANREEMLVYNRAWRAANPEKAQVKHRRHTWRSRYGQPPSWLLEALEMSYQLRRRLGLAMNGR